jgi:hypothetical protein
MALMFQSIFTYAKGPMDILTEGMDWLRPGFQSHPASAI